MTFDRERFRLRPMYIYIARKKNHTFDRTIMLKFMI